MRPGIVCVELRAWGREGPWRERRGFDTIVQTATGMALVSGGGTEPRLMPVSAIDYVSGHLMAYGAMVALTHRLREIFAVSSARAPTLPSLRNVPVAISSVAQTGPKG
jgi:crotonobetainyl-CoA:carnitine CoA-transferase CaiB-like acyl-CoA transferase